MILADSKLENEYFWRGQAIGSYAADNVNWIEVLYLSL